MWFCLPLPVILVLNSWNSAKKHLLVSVRKLMFFKYSCQRPLKKNCGRPVFLEEFQTTINFSKVSLHFNKIPNSSRQVLQIYSQICIFCVPQKQSSRSSQQRLISKCHGNLVVKLMTMWWNSYYSKFGSKIRRWFGILGISFFIRFFNFLQIL